MNPRAKVNFETAPVSARRWRWLGATVALVAAYAVVELLTRHRSTQPLVGHLSARAIAALVASCVVAVCGTVIALLPRERLIRCLTVLAPQTHPDSQARRATQLAWLAALPLLAAFLAQAQAAEDLSADEVHFLALARSIGERGGVLQLLADLYSGQWREANRHPLYPLAVYAVGGTRHRAAAVSVAATALALVAAYAAIRRLTHSAPAAAAAVLYAACTAATLRASVSVLADGTLACCVLWSWYAALRAADSAPFRQFLAWSTVAAATAGLAYMAKATGLLWCTLPLVALALQRERGIETASTVVLMMLTWTTIASPLLVRNTIVYGNPLHNYNARFLFADTFEDGQVEQPTGLREAARSFVERHGWQGVCRRVARGIVWECFIMARGSGPLGPTAARLLLGSVVFGLAAFYLTWYSGGWVRGSIGATVVCGLVLFGWYTPIASSERLVLPAIVCGAAVAVGGLAARARGERLLAISLAIVAYASAAVLAGPAHWWPKL